MGLSSDQLQALGLRLLPLVAIAAAGMLFWDLGGPALIDPDEGRNAAIAWEMTDRGNLLVPHLDGLPFLDKPFLYFSAVAASLTLFDDLEFAARMPSLAATLLTLALVGWFATRVLGVGRWLAILMLGTAPLVITYSRIVIFDSKLALCVVSALVSFYLTIESSVDGASGSKRWSVAAYVAMALGTMVKGPVAVALPLMVALPFSLWRRRPR